MSRTARHEAPRRSVFGAPLVSTLLAVLWLAPIGVARGEDPKVVDLKKQVQLLGAQGNEKLQHDVEPGNLRLPLTLVTPLDSKLPEGELSTSDFAAEGKAPHRVPATLVMETADSTKPPSPDSRTLPLRLQANRVAFDLVISGLRPNTVYRGPLLLRSGPSTHAWEITVKAADRGVVAVDKVPIVKLVKWHPCGWCEFSPGRFVITLRDASARGPYPNVRARFEDVRAPSSTAIASNFAIDALAFSIPGTKGVQSMDLGSHGAPEVPVTGKPPAAGSMAPLPAVPKEGHVTLWVQTQGLSPGEYAGTLRFSADGASENADESKLALTLQVRHHWWVAVVVAIIGALVGWFVNKYVQGYRTGRRLRAEAKAQSEAAAYLARPEPARAGWQFPGEGTSYGFIRVRVLLHQVDRLARNTLLVIVAETTFTERLGEARRRLGSLEALAATRAAVQRFADHRFAAQRAIGGGLRRVLDILDRPGFGDGQRDQVANSLKDLEKWTAADTGEALYRTAVERAMRDATDGALAAGYQATTKDPDGPPTLEDRIGGLLRMLAASRAVSNRTIDALFVDDERCARLTLLVRDHAMPWGKDLAKRGDAPMSALYGIADAGLWTLLEESARNEKICLEGPGRSIGQTVVQTYDPVEIRLIVEPFAGQSPSDVRSRIARHPCLVRWRIEPSAGEATPTESESAGDRRRPKWRRSRRGSVRRAGLQRSVETDGLALVQYFPNTSTVTIRAELVWNGKTIEVPESHTIKVEENSECRPRDGLWSPVDLAASGVAAVFAILTGLHTVYDATFGTAGQYVTLFLWSAGASTVGNLAKQLGASPTGGAPAAGAAPAAAGQGAATAAPTPQATRS